MEIEAIANLMKLGTVILFVVLLVIFIYFSITMMHHWGYYSFNSTLKRISQSIYFLVSIPLLILILIFIGTYIFGNGI